MRELELAKTLRATVIKYQLLEPGQTVVVGVSGGPDSTALLHALVELRREWELTLVVAHLNHGFRDEEANQEEAIVEALAAQWGLRCYHERVEVPALQQRQHLSAQEAARQVRHGFLRRVATEVGAGRIALGHTRSDRVETMLLNLLRGTGIEGLGGFPPANFPIIRPLYEVSREQVEAYCVAHQLHPCEDSSNKKSDYLRNRVRSELLPYLTTYYNEGVENVLVRLADLAFADNALLEQMAQETLVRLTHERAEHRLLLESTGLREIPRALQRRVIRQAIAEVRGHLTNVRFEPIEHLLEAIAEKRNYAIDLPAEAGKTVRCAYEEPSLSLIREVPPSSPLPWECELQVPGRTELPGGRGSVLTEVHFRHPTPDTRHPQNVVFFRCSDIEFPLVARTWRPGDRMTPLGVGGSKKLQDIFTDRKVPSHERSAVPVIVEAGGRGRILAVGTLHWDRAVLRLADLKQEDFCGDVSLLAISLQ